MFDWLTPSVAVGVQNALWAGMGWSVALVFGIYFLHTRGERWDGARELALGIFLVSLGGSIHRTYWWFWRLMLSHDNQAAADVLSDFAVALWLPVILILLGYALHLRARLRDIFQGRWWLPVAAWFSLLVAITFAAYGDF